MTERWMLKICLLIHEIITTIDADVMCLRWTVRGEKRGRGERSNKQI